MALLRVDARALVPRLRAELAALLTSLTSGDWALPTACPGWSVHDVAAHLLHGQLGNVSVRRDRWGLGPAEGEDLDTWLNRFNQQWVDAARRISPALLIELIDLAGRRFEEHLASNTSCPARYFVQLVFAASSRATSCRFFSTITASTPLV